MRYRAIKLAVIFAVVSLGSVCPRLASSAETLSGQVKRKQKPARQRQIARPDYAKFSHASAQHKQLPCDACHKFPTANWNKARKSDEAFPDVTDYPEHSSCLSCHRQQFFSGAQPAICSNCHTNPSPRDSSRHPFPNPKEVFDASKKGQTSEPEFGVSFPHDKHIEIVGQLSPDPIEDRSAGFVAVAYRQKKEEPKKEESEPKSCAVCHQTYQPQGDSDDEFATKPPKDLPESAFWLKKGAFKTSPAGHAICFTCHSQDSGIKPAQSDCNMCHKLLPREGQTQIAQAHDDYDPKLAATMGIKSKAVLEFWSRRDTARFRHEWLPHAGLSCVSCHNVAAIDTMDAKTKKVRVQSCGGEGTGCHIEATADGALNFEVEKKKADPAFQCVKCHINNGKKAAPESHLNAVRAAAKK